MAGCYFFFSFSFYPRAVVPTCAQRQGHPNVCVLDSGKEFSRCRMTEKYFGSSTEPSIFDKMLANPSVEDSSSMGFRGNVEAIPVADEIRDLWQPPEQEPGVPPLLTMPGVLSSEDLTDPVREAIATAFGPEEAKKNPSLTCNDVTQDERGLRKLIDEGCFRAAVNLTGRLLTIYGQGYGRLGQPAKHTPHSLQLWFTRFTLLVKLGMFDLCQMESDAFGELARPDIYYEFYPEMYTNRRGSMGSFSFRLLLAELPMYLGAANVALNRLTAMENTCRKIERVMQSTGVENNQKFWRRRRVRVQHSIINCALMLKNFSMVHHFIESLIEEKCWTNEELGALYSVAGKIYLQCGDILMAEKKLTSMRKLGLTSQEFQVQECVDKGLIYVAQNDFEEALKCFQKASSLQPTNAMISNNVAVCLLYLGRMKEAIATYENMTENNPKQAINENFMINLCTLEQLVPGKIDEAPQEGFSGTMETTPGDAKDTEGLYKVEDFPLPEDDEGKTVDGDKESVSVSASASRSVNEVFDEILKKEVVALWSSKEKEVTEEKETTVGNVQEENSEKELLSGGNVGVFEGNFGDKIEEKSNEIEEKEAEEENPEEIFRKLESLLAETKDEMEVDEEKLEDDEKVSSSKEIQEEGKIVEGDAEDNEKEALQSSSGKESNEEAEGICQEVESSDPNPLKDLLEDKDLALDEDSTSNGELPARRTPQDNKESEIVQHSGQENVPDLEEMDLDAPDTLEKPLKGAEMQIDDDEEFAAELEALKEEEEEDGADVQESSDSEVIEEDIVEAIKLPQESSEAQEAPEENPPKVQEAKEDDEELPEASESLDLPEDHPEVPESQSNLPEDSSQNLNVEKPQGSAEKHPELPEIDEEFTKIEDSEEANKEAEPKLPATANVYQEEEVPLPDSTEMEESHADAAEVPQEEDMEMRKAVEAILSDDSFPDLQIDEEAAVSTIPEDREKEAEVQDKAIDSQEAPEKIPENKEEKEALPEDDEVVLIEEDEPEEDEKGKEASPEGEKDKELPQEEIAQEKNEEIPKEAHQEEEKEEKDDSVIEIPEDEPSQEVPAATEAAKGEEENHEEAAEDHLSEGGSTKNGPISEEATKAASVTEDNNSSMSMDLMESNDVPSERADTVEDNSTPMDMEVDETANAEWAVKHFRKESTEEVSNKEASKESTMDRQKHYDCINSACKSSAAEEFSPAHGFIVSFYSTKKRKKTQYVCRPCYAVAMEKMMDYCSILTAQKPIFHHFPQHTEVVEISDSSEDSSPEDEMVQCMRRPLKEADRALIEKNLDEVIAETMKRVNINQQFEWTKHDLDTRFSKLEKSHAEVNEEFQKIQRTADSLFKNLNSREKQTTQNEPPIHIYTEFPPPEDRYAPVNYRMIRERATPCHVLDKLPGNGGDKDMRYRVRFVRHNQEGILSGKQLAFAEAPTQKLSVGCRVVAQFSAARRKLYYPGIVAEPTQETNKFRYLIFFDDGYVQYVFPGDVRRICWVSENVWEDVHPSSRDFIRNYLQENQYQRAVAQVKIGQKIEVERDGKWVSMRVAKVDCSLILVYFGEYTEWIYSGSQRLLPIYRMKMDSRLSTGKKLQTRNEPYVSFRNVVDDSQKETENRVKEEEENRGINRSVAKKSTQTVPPLPVAQPSQPSQPKQLMNNSTIFLEDDNYPKGKVVFYTAKFNMPPKSYTPHECNSECLYRISYDLNLYNPLAKPLLSGWERKIYRVKARRSVIYKAPCGRSLRNIEEVHRYLRLTDCSLNVDNYDFDPSVHCLAEYVIDSAIVRKTDISNGVETMPIGCVNCYDETVPPPCIYANHRIPTEGVHLNLDPEFLVGCDCTDDCMDKSKCSCWQTTAAGVRCLQPNIDINTVGYTYKKLYDPVPTGIYECNSRCKCKSSCLNLARSTIHANRSSKSSTNPTKVAGGAA
uniref:Putative histone-lysine n-methyltransferase eggless n=1 Tax=Lutzomyia longipalpis TaxID=7200 RepID=A0A7G3AJM5_LUTLO